MSERPEDRGRRQRRSRTASGSAPGEPSAAGGAPGQPAAGLVEGPEEEVALSRTLFSFLEPTLDTIGSFSAPIVIAGIVGLVSGISLVAFVGSMKPYGVANILIGVALIGLVALISLSAVVAGFFSRTGRYGVNTVIMLAAFTGIVVVANFISFENNRRMDVTATNQFSLANRTKNLLKELKEPVQATAFYKNIPREGDPSLRNEQTLQAIARRAKVQETLEEFEARSSKFSYRIVDPDLRPAITNSYFGSLPTGFATETVVVEGEDSKIIGVIFPTDPEYSEFEQDLVTNILVATGEERKTVYFLTGHGERNIDSALGDGYADLNRGLTQDNYDVRTLTWAASDEDVRVPAGPEREKCSPEEECLSEAALVVVARPTGELPQAHAEALDLYMIGKMRDPDAPDQIVDRRESGRMIFLAEPDIKDSFREFLIRWGVGVDSRHILDRIRSVEGDPYTLLPTFNPEAPLEIVFPRGEMLGNVIMPGAAALNLLLDDARRPVPLVVTSGDSYLIGDVERTEPITDAGDQSDPQGPFFPVVWVQAIGPLGTPAPVSTLPDSQISSLVVFGDSDLVANSFYGRGSGADLFLNSANFLMGNYSLVSIREKAFTFREFNLNRNERRFVRWSSWVMLPGLLALMAGLVWWVRR